MRDIYNSLPFGVIILKRDMARLDILYMNNRIKKAFDIEDEKGLSFENLWPGDSGIRYARKLKSPIPPTEYTLPLLNEDEEEIGWYKITLEEEDFEGENALILWMNDITYNKKEERLLKEAVAQADASAEMKANFLATMSHEIRTPMQSVYGLLELIGQENPPPSILEMVKTAQNSASGLLEILDDILDFAKMDADKMELDMFEVPVRTLVRGINEALAVKVHGKKVKLLDNIEQDVPFVVIGDPKRLRQIIMNLMGNAMKFTEEGSVTLHVTTDVQELAPPRSGLNLRFEIIDTGIGMPKKVCDRLFQAFSQADNSTSRKYGGTGLGLSICKKLVDLMGGKIGVKSIEGKGSTFWFEIPTQEVSTEAETIDMPSLDGLHILSVEDHPQGAKEIVRTLSSMNARVENVSTYQEGLELIKRRPFDVAIIDQGLPDGLGIDLIREIMEIRPFMGLIMYTVRDDKGLQHTLQSLGVKYLTKPASRRGLGQTVEEAATKATKFHLDGPRRLLIAEDTESVQDLLSRQLKALGTEADFVTNGVEALKALDTGQYGILFTDLHMPEMDGYELIETIRKQEKKTDIHTPVIVLTADVQMAQREVYLEHGFDECLLKPVSLGQFKRLLIRWGLLYDNEEVNSQTEGELKSDAVQKAEDLSKQQGEPNLPPAVDIEAMRELMGTFDETSIEMLGMFIDMTRPIIEKVKSAHAASDLKALREAAHSLKGGARSACCTHLGNLAAELQENSENDTESPVLVEKIMKEFERVTKTIQAMQP